MKRFLLRSTVALLACLPLGGQPVVNPGGVLNTASFTLDGLSSSGIAQGSMFAVFGEDLGPAELTQAPLPLPTELAGTSIEVSVGGTAVNAFVFFSSATQLAAVLPSSTPPGEGTLVVTFDGQSSDPVAITVKRSAFGIFTRNQAGFGPAIVQNFVSETEQPVNAFISAAAPGQPMILWGTGLGPISESDADRPPVGNLAVEVEVVVGGRRVMPAYAGRSAEFPGVDQVNFLVPAGIEGCYVPLAVEVDGVMSNYGTMAISSQGRHCSNPFSTADMDLAERNGELRIGTIYLERLFFTAPHQGILDREDNVFVQFKPYSLNSLLATELRAVDMQGLFLPSGSCMAYTKGGRGLDPFPEEPFEPGDLDAGGEFALTGPGGTTLFDELPTDFLQPGLYTVDNGDGGDDVGPFAATLTRTTVATWANKDSIERVPRSDDLTVTWTRGESATGRVAVAGVSADFSAGVQGSFICWANAADKSLTVPAAVLSSLPASNPPTGAPGLLFLTADTSPFTAPGLDVGYFMNVTVTVSLVGFR